MVLNLTVRESRVSSGSDCFPPPHQSLSPPPPPVPQHISACHWCRSRIVLSCPCSLQPPQDDLLQLAVVGALYALDRSFDVGIQARGAFCQCLAVVDGNVAVVHGDEVEEQTGDASVEFVKWMQCNQFGLVMSETFGKFFCRPVYSLFQVLLLFQFAEDAACFLFEVGCAAEQRAAFAHVHGALQARPFVLLIRYDLFMSPFEFDHSLPPLQGEGWGEDGCKRRYIGHYPSPSWPPP
jgi:hypothetical protein